MRLNERKGNFPFQDYLLYLGAFVLEELFERLPKEAAVCSQSIKQHPLGRQEGGMSCPKPSACKGRGCRRGASGQRRFCVCVWGRRQEQLLGSHRCQEGQRAEVKPEEEEAPGDRSQVRVVRTCKQMTPKQMISPHSEGYFRV